MLRQAWSAGGFQSMGFPKGPNPLATQLYQSGENPPSPFVLAGVGSMGLELPPCSWLGIWIALPLLRNTKWYLTIH